MVEGLDRRRFDVAAALTKEPNASDRSIAARVGIHHRVVAEVRKELERAGTITKIAKRYDVTGRRQPVRRQA